MLVIFDLDGTLIDSAPDLRIAVNQVLADYGHGPLELAQIRAMIGDGASQLVTRAFAAHGVVSPDSSAALKKFFTYYQADPTAHTVLYDGVRETLDLLRSRGVVMALCTNKPAAPMHEILKRLDVAHYFSQAIGGDTHAFKKPDPRMLTVLMSAAGATTASTVMVGDSEVDAATAAAAGVPFALVTYGYRRGKAESILAQARYDNFAQILGLITSTPRGVLA